MKATRIVTILVIQSFLSTALSAQVYVQKGGLKVGVRVTKNGKELSLDSLCSSFHHLTNEPIDMLVPEGSVVELLIDDKSTGDRSIQVKNQEPDYINRPKQESLPFGMSNSAGSFNSYTFTDGARGETITIEWKVGYVKMTLIELLPADDLDDYINATSRNGYKEYNDTSRYDWSKHGFIERIDASGFPIAPSFPHDHPGLLFVIYATETAVIQMKGYHDQFLALDHKNPLDLLLYKALPPGDYEFIAKPYADAPERLWLKYPFSVQVPWWQNQQTLFILGVLFLAITVSAMVAIVLYLKKRKEKELHWKQRLTDAELKAIRAQLNPHFLFNALNSIQNLVSQQKNELANAYINKLSRLLRQVLSSSERQFHELEDELQLTQLYLELEQLRFSFSLDIVVDPKMDGNTLVPTMLLQPYVENAVKHGISGQANGKIQIKVHSGKQQLHFQILDNGPGLSIPSGQSKGLALGKSRINHLNNLYTEQAKVNIGNRENESGVIVNISLPIT